jgi:hypothetical protein
MMAAKAGEGGLVRAAPAPPPSMPTPMPTPGPMPLRHRLHRLYRLPRAGSQMWNMAGSVPFPAGEVTPTPIDDPETQTPRKRPLTVVSVSSSPWLRPYEWPGPHATRR